MTRAKIMVVEDERITAEDIRDGLESLGYQVPPILSTGEDAVKMVEEISPDLVLMDIMLGGEMDGIEAAENIRSRFGIPVIYLTAYSDENTVERAKITEPSGYLLKDGVDYINKPFEEGELHTAIEITLYKHKMELRLRENERWLSAILKNISEALIATDSHRRVKFMNYRAEELTGWLKEDALGNDLMEVLNPISGQLALLELDDVSMARKLEFSGELIRDVEGNEMKVKGTLSPITDEKGEIEGWVIVFRNNY